MSSKYKADFEKFIIKYSGIKISNPGDVKCYLFSLKNSSTLIPGVCQLVPGKLVKDKWLYGPATQLGTKNILYPCSRYKCGIPCLCIICQKLQTNCLIPPSRPCSCRDCNNLFEDHSQYHATLHLNCKYCLNMIENMPNISFAMLKVENKKQVVLGTTDSVARKPLEIELEPQAPEPSIDYLGKRNRHEDLGGYYCDFCDTLLWSMPQLREHIQLNHFESKVFRHNYSLGLIKCYQCPNYFSSILNWNRHVESVHYSETFECKKCGETFSRKDSLRRHKKLHRKKREKFVCDNCGKQFTTAESLIKHKKAHDNEASDEFKCELCGTTFTQKDNHQRHQKGIHNEDGSFVHKCSHCNETFCTSKLLKSHCKAKHDNNVSCEECGQKFTLKRSLDLHMKKRNIVTCGECENKFCNLKALSIHKNEVHNYIECDVCGNKYQKKYVEALQHHKFWVHNQIPNK